MSAVEELAVILPPLKRVLHPNCSTASQGMRFAKASAVKAQRRRTREAIALEECESLPWKRCSVKADFYFGTKRGRDVDNLMGALKSTYDGIVDAGVVPDDIPEFMVREMPTINYDKEYPRVELTITRLA